MNVSTLDDYLREYGSLVADMTRKRFTPLFDPTVDIPPPLDLDRQLYPAQADAVAGLIHGWNTQKSLFLCGECGTGKTSMAIAAVDGHAKGNYRALAFCPDHLVRKWATLEIPTVLSRAKVTVIDDWKLLPGLRTLGKPTAAEWYVIGRDKSKYGAKWRAAFRLDRRDRRRCPVCNELLLKKINESNEAVFWTDKELAATKRYCRNCGSPLWQYTRELDRWAPATYIHKHLKGFFDYLVIDEAHEEKAENTAQAVAAGSLVAASRKVLAMTGTLIGGYADHIRPLLFRLSPGPLRQSGLEWSNRMEFVKRYGRLDTIVTEKSGSETANRQSRGSSRQTRRQTKPGIMPTLYGNHLLGNSVFVSLEQMSDHLPALREESIAVEMHPTVANAYSLVEEALREATKELLKKGNKQLLGPMLQALLTYPDYPWHWKEIGYVDHSGERSGGEGAWVSVVTPPHLEETVRMNKERELLKILAKEQIEGRQCWVFVESTTTHPVLERLANTIARAGFRVAVMRQSDVPRKDRDAWIAKHAPGCDVILSHPKLVETGVDLFDKEHTPQSYNFVSLVFFQTGYNLFTLRQASRRAWRLAQTEPCRVYYLYFGGTMQEKAMQLMGKKLKASLALEGKFSSEGMAAMAGDEGDMAMELAKSLVDKLDLSDGNWEPPPEPQHGWTLLDPFDWPLHSAV